MERLRQQLEKALQDKQEIEVSNMSKVFINDKKIFKCK
jgi:hypothetical protein